MKKFNTFILDINLAEKENILEKEFELLTTAKQTDWRYWDFEFSKEDLEEMAKNFNENIVWTEIPVDLNHDPEHIAYAWISPWSMIVKKSSKMKGYSLYAKLYKFTPEWIDIIQTWKIRYFSLQIQHKFEKFVDKTKKIYNNVIRALALTNMPVIKDMAPTLSEENNKILFNNHIKSMEKEKLEAQLSEVNKNLSDKDKILKEKEAENKNLSEKLEKIEAEKLETFLSESLKKLSLSDNQKIWFKGGEKEKILSFVKTLSEEQAKLYFELHQDIITSANFNEEWETWKEEDKKEWNATEEVDKKAKDLAEKKNITYSDALDIVLWDEKLADRYYAEEEANIKKVY